MAKAKNASARTTKPKAAKSKAKKNKIVPRNLPDPLERGTKKRAENRVAQRSRKRADDERNERATQNATAARIEGRHAVAEALEAHIALRRAYILKSSSHDARLDALEGRLEQQGVPIDYVSREKLDALSERKSHQGIVVETQPFAYASLADIVKAAGSGDALVVVLDHVTDEGNLGAIIRSAEVVGAAGVVLPRARAARVGIGAIKTSAGAAMHVPIARVSNLASALDELKAAGFWVCAATEHATQLVWDAPLSGRLALVMGSEDEGISRLVRATCDFECKLPQVGRIESLNVAQATTVMAYEWMRNSAAGKLARAATSATE